MATRYSPALGAAVDRLPAGRAAEVHRRAGLGGQRAQRRRRAAGPPAGDPVTVRDVLGHADLKTTERYLHPVRASRLAAAVTRAFTHEPDPEQAARASFRALVEQLGTEETRRVLDPVG